MEMLHLNLKFAWKTTLLEVLAPKLKHFKKPKDLIIKIEHKKVDEKLLKIIAKSLLELDNVEHCSLAWSNVYNDQELYKEITIEIKHIIAKHPTVMILDLAIRRNFGCSYTTRKQIRKYHA